MTFRNENAATTAVADNAKAGRSSGRLRMAVMGGVLAALPVAGLVTATTASAASTATWDAVAQCESTGNWSINSGNGFYGGLQFTSSTWAAFGGTQYAPQANQATKAQQIAIAEKVLASQGPGAWPVCSVKAGLTAGGAPAAVDTSAPAPAPAAQAPATQAPAAKPVAAPKQSTAPAPKPTKPAPKPAAPVAPVAPAAPAAPSTGGTYTVKSGDTLSGIAAAKGLNWQTLYKNNTQVIGGNADLILPGQVLAV
ncbi:LysM repeat protein [Kitasatospora sp. MAP12-15]|uniref:LysM peptidoglycan-binding domain-containing protein n=1 Tax=unclassified Kitasatospora TaxID=2633591 RepID=UPI0024740F58|nr:transglycosylase family protein [Kitasatospora sp. MAP12-44]MDH6113560.1 LysM repeat protein [Kitasatospora sp. MAP12-44]